MRFRDMFIVMLMIFVPAYTAPAQNYLAPPKHDPNDPSHWYSYYCCHLNDCGPVKEWKKVDGGWIVTNGMGLKAFLPEHFESDPKITKKPSQDTEYHACITIDMRNAEDGKGRIQCLYVPMNA